jgi:hypothetical protein
MSSSSSSFYYSNNNNNNNNHHNHQKPFVLDCSQCGKQFNKCFCSDPDPEIKRTKKAYQEIEDKLEKRDNGMVCAQVICNRCGSSNPLTCRCPNGRVTRRRREEAKRQFYDLNDYLLKQQQQQQQLQENQEQGQQQKEPTHTYPTDFLPTIKRPEGPLPQPPSHPLPNQQTAAPQPPPSASPGFSDYDGFGGYGLIPQSPQTLPAPFPIPTETTTTGFTAPPSPPMLEPIAYNWGQYPSPLVLDQPEASATTVVVVPPPQQQAQGEEEIRSQPDILGLWTCIEQRFKRQDHEIESLKTETAKNKIERMTMKHEINDLKQQIKQLGEEIAKTKQIIASCGQSFSQMLNKT